MKARTVFLACAFVMTTYATSAAAEEKAITAQEFADLIVDNTLQERRKGKKKWNLHAKKDGTAKFRNESGFTDSGKWEVKGNKFCWKWREIRDGRNYCIRDIRIDGNAITYYNEAGRDVQTQIIKQGIHNSF